MTTGQDPAQLFGPPPTSATQQQLFTGGSVLQTRTGVAAAADAWSVGAMNLDLDDLAVDLLEASMRRPGPQPDHAPGRHASALMMAGRYADALAVLPAGLVLPDPGSDDLQRDHLVQATCRAALGDDGALLWLRQAAPLISATDWAGYIAHCLLRVGDARGDLELAGASLAQLQRLGDRGRRVVPRMAADVVASRPRSAPAGRAGRGRLWGSNRDHPAAVAVREAADRLRLATDLLHGPSESFVSDPGLVLETAERLRQGGDPQGAALLLHAVDRTNPHVRRVEEALATYVPPGAYGRRRLRRALLLTLAGIAFLVSGLTGHPMVAVVAALVVGGVEIFAREPGLDRFGTNVLAEYAEKAGIRPFWLLPRSVADETPVAGTRRRSPLVLGVVALALGAVVFPGAWDAAAEHGTGTSWLTSPGLTSFLVWVVLFPVLVTWAVSLLPGRRLGYVVPRLSAAQTDCQCRRFTGLSGPFAFAYAAGHLTPLATPPELEPALRRFSPLPPSVSGCPMTGAAWLVLILGPENGRLLLRSPIGTFPDPEERPDDSLPTGQYL
ncbi:hypothetical protein [Microlunatus flavus]|uniref:Uncharacterized protein n=1 Tax=Microlunatus flavus TaxID=1036181 RepID=A0A1H9CFV3_9ACTN|nr:hypothetical protein [Microlunatus flavus]SEP99921.1 hypothetical protein SAMN05421756_102190 [Microlunatus flavus]